MSFSFDLIFEMLKKGESEEMDKSVSWGLKFERFGKCLVLEAKQGSN